MTRNRPFWSALGLGLALALALLGAPAALASGHGNESDAGSGDPDNDARNDERDRDADEDPESDRDPADDRDDDRDDRDDRDGRERSRDEQRRTIAVKTDNERIEIELKRQQNGTEDKVETSFDFEDAEFETKFESEDLTSEFEVKLEATFQALIEYRDANANGRYDAGEAIVSAWALGDDDDLDDFDASPDGRIRWETPTAQQVVVDGQTGQQINAPAALGDGRFELVFTVFGDFAQIGQASLQPTSVKVDILIEDYPYQENDTALALLLETKSSTEFSHERDHEDMQDDEQGVAATAAAGAYNVTLAFVWKDHADVDGAQRSVGTTLLKSEQETEDGERQLKERFALSYARGDRIVHDPESYVAIAAASVTQPTPGLTIGILAVVALAAAGLRRRWTP